MIAVPCFDCQSDVNSNQKIRVSRKGPSVSTSAPNVDRFPWRVLSRFF